MLESILYQLESYVVLFWCQIGQRLCHIFLPEKNTPHSPPPPPHFKELNCLSVSWVTGHFVPKPFCTSHFVPNLESFRTKPPVLYPLLKKSRQYYTEICRQPRNFQIVNRCWVDVDFWWKHAPRVNDHDFQSMLDCKCLTTCITTLFQFCFGRTFIQVEVHGELFETKLHF